ncbi:YojF family protein [Gracilibacillus caseinilyticus]|uniref:YojF family protein n=1 Tax=Gracilibacillus caseinilyticus TaxID=2932256 RepID=A0ABY4EVK6_9BACI|nr:YojF family protein [Gracilibacillus caseinilyticus]UOQ48268.1 YojF family protein [Gracilibacillus caseinilyticus]
MEPIEINQLQKHIDDRANKDVYVHLETTNGAYASHFNEDAYNVGAFIRNAKVKYQRGKVVGAVATYRVGLKLDIGWIYAEGVNQFEINDQNQLLMAGHDREGRLMVSLQISETPFHY